MKSVSKTKSVSKKPVPKKSRGKTCVCRKRIEFLSPGYTQNGKPCFYCADCIPF